MENQTQQILSSVLGDEFKIEVEKRDSIIKNLNAQINTAQNEINSLKKDVEDLSVRKNSLKDELTMAFATKEESFKAEQDNFKLSIENTIKSLDTREKSIEDKFSQHDKDVQEHQSDVSNFNKEVIEFTHRRVAIIDTLNESLKLHTSLLQDAIEAIKQPFQEETKLITAQLPQVVD